MDSTIHARIHTLTSVLIKNHWIPLNNKRTNKPIKKKKTLESITKVVKSTKQEENKNRKMSKTQEQTIDNQPM